MDTLTSKQSSCLEMLEGLREVSGDDEGSRRREDQWTERFLFLLDYGLIFHTQTFFLYILSYFVTQGIMYGSGYLVWVLLSFHMFTSAITNFL